ncbi:MAG: gephyrin-like molybdotransferase Glp [Arthrobacter sp.]|uniref:molybdopterin molybdotransferase MoeA n=1 Tax=Arthrobacter sp. TaxID=1667 RepID=UPI00348F9BAD
MDHSFRRTVGEHRDAVRALLSALAPALGTETVPLAAAAGRTLAADLRAPHSLPPFDNSQMDGYAVRAAELAAGPGPTLARPIPAGADAPFLVPGTAAPIMTGAMMPRGADAVVPVEATDPPSFPAFVAGAAAYDAGTRVAFPSAVPVGQFVRAAGSDIAAGATALRAGTRLRATHLGLAAALGVAGLGVLRRPRALLLSTGDEVAAPGAPLGPGQIHDANTTLLAVLLADAGWEVRAAGISADSVGAFGDALARELAPGAGSGETGYDLVLTSGGISKGAFEVVRLALSARGVAFGSVGMQPGGPQGAGLLELPGARPTPFLAFPGNPVSSFVSFELLLRPALSDLLGLPPRRVVEARLAEGIGASPAGKLQALRAVFSPGGVGGAGEIRPVGGPASHLLHALASANALILVPAGTTAASAGDTVEALLIGENP